jgi:hypothetical protein
VPEAFTRAVCQLKEAKKREGGTKKEPSLERLDPEKR